MAKLKGTIWLTKFDPAVDYLANRVMTVSGKKFAVGDLFDKQLVPTRRLRQLYECRKLLPASPEVAAALKERAGGADKPKAEAKVRKPVTARRGKPAKGRTPKATATKQKPVKASTPKASQKPQNLPVAAEAPISIPPDWQKLPWAQRLSLAANFGKAKTKEEVAAVIEAELARRGKPA